MISQARLPTVSSSLGEDVNDTVSSVPVQCRHLGGQMDALRACMEMAKVPAGCRHLGGQMDALRVCMENLMNASYETEVDEEEYSDVAM